METIILAATDALARTYAVELLRLGELVALPTDTVYGVAADGFDVRAIEKLFIAKERPTHKAIIYLLACSADLNRIADMISPVVYLLAEKFWPGGLTLVVRAREEVPAILRADGATIGVRVPNTEIVWYLDNELGHPLAVTSANLSGQTNPSNAAQVLEQLGGRIPLILDGGETGSEVASTVLDCTVDPPRVLRAGVVPIQNIEDVLGFKLG